MQSLWTHRKHQDADDDEPAAGALGTVDVVLHCARVPIALVAFESNPTDERLCIDDATLESIDATRAKKFGAGEHL